MENIIYNDLIRRGYRVDVGVVYDRRNNKKIQRVIDFVVNDLDRRVYIQRAYEITSKEKASSELAPLTLSGDFYKKIVIRNDILHHYHDHKGFLHCNLLDFLMERIELF